MKKAYIYSIIRN